MIVKKLFIRTDLNDALYKICRNVFCIFQRKKEKLATAGLVYSIDYCVCWLFNYPLYILVMNEFGLQKGFIDAGL